jgi:predicted metal-dependent peptidase
VTGTLATSVASTTALVVSKSGAQSELAAGVASEETILEGIAAIVTDVSGGIVDRTINNIVVERDRVSKHRRL